MYTGTDMYTTDMNLNPDNSMYIFDIIYAHFRTFYHITLPAENIEFLVNVL